jgi:hypothetical protein
LHVELRVVLRADGSRRLANCRGAEACARSEADASVERGAEDGDVTTVDIVELREAHKRR